MIRLLLFPLCQRLTILSRKHYKAIIIYSIADRHDFIQNSLVWPHLALQPLG